MGRQISLIGVSDTSQYLIGFVGMANLVNLSVYHGETVTITVTVQDAITGAVQNITGQAFSFIMRNTPDTSGSSLINKSVGSGITIPVGTDGRMVITLASSDTQQDPTQQYWYTLARTDSGFQAVLANGTFTVLAETVL